MRFVFHSACVAFLSAAFLMGCSFVDPCVDDEIQRLPSPDGKVDAVIIKRNCGATTSFAYLLFIVPSGDKISGSTSPIFEADHLKNEDLFWKEPKFLNIVYEQARIFHFSNFWHSKEIDNFEYVVEIRETPRSAGHALSATDRWEK